MLRALVIVACALVLGGVLTVAFNPDDGTVAHTEALWRIGGLMVYAGFAAVPLALGYTIMRGLWHVIRAAVRASRPSPPRG